MPLGYREGYTSALANYKPIRIRQPGEQTKFDAIRRLFARASLLADTKGYLLYPQFGDLLVKITTPGEEGQEVWAWFLKMVQAVVNAPSVVSADGTTFEAGGVAGGEPYPFFFTQTHDYNNEQWPIVPALKPHPPFGQVCTPSGITGPRLLASGFSTGWCKVFYFLLRSLWDPNGMTGGDSGFSQSLDGDTRTMRCNDWLPMRNNSHLFGRGTDLLTSTVIATVLAKYLIGGWSVVKRHGQKQVMRDANVKLLNASIPVRWLPMEAFRFVPWGSRRDHIFDAGVDSWNLFVALFRKSPNLAFPAVPAAISNSLDAAFNLAGLEEDDQTWKRPFYNYQST